MELVIKHTDYQKFMKSEDPRFDCIFADPPDNIGLDYDVYDDKKSDGEYWWWLHRLLEDCDRMATTAWISYNVKHMCCMMCAGDYLCEDTEVRHMIQTFTFGQHRTTDFGNNFRPLVRLSKPNSLFYPDHIRVESERQRLGDKRANPEGRVPGDVFDFPRVVGNSSQRRSWHPTQLNEGLVERCLASCCKTGDKVFDPFMGTGTTLRVCKRIGLDCVTTDVDRTYCVLVAEENGLEQIDSNTWKGN